MNTKFVIKGQEPKTEFGVLSLEKENEFEIATVVLTLPNGTRAPLVGFETTDEGKLQLGRWTIDEEDGAQDYIEINENSTRIFDRLPDERD